jgi:hypothetical protein
MVNGLGLKECSDELKSPAILIIFSSSGVHIGSILGLFLRQCILSFRLLPFEAVARMQSSLMQLALLHASADGSTQGHPRDTTSPMSRIRQQKDLERVFWHKNASLNVSS